MQKYELQAVPTATAARLGAKPVRLMGFVIAGGSDNSGVEFKNAATDTGTVLVSAKCLANDSVHICLEEYGGVEFDVGCFCKPSGTGCIVYALFQ